MAKDKSTVRAALSHASRRNRTKTGADLGPRELHRRIGEAYTNQKHECTTGPNGCDPNCPLAHPTA